MYFSLECDIDGLSLHRYNISFEGHVFAFLYRLAKKWRAIFPQYLYNIGQKYERVRKRSRKSDRNGLFPNHYNISFKEHFFLLYYILDW